MNTQNINLILNFTHLFENLAVVNSAALSEILIEAGIKPSVLGTGDQYSSKLGYRKWALASPTYIEESYEMLIVEIDANLDAEAQFHAVQILAKFDLDKPIILLVPESRKLGIKKAFSPFGLLALSPRVDLEGEHFVILSNWELSE